MLIELILAIIISSIIGWNIQTLAVTFFVMAFHLFMFPLIPMVDFGLPVWVWIIAFIIGIIDIFTTAYRLSEE